MKLAQTDLDSGIAVEGQANERPSLPAGNSHQKAIITIPQAVAALVTGCDRHTGRWQSMSPQIGQMQIAGLACLLLAFGLRLLPANLQCVVDKPSHFFSTGQGFAAGAGVAFRRR